MSEKISTDQYGRKQWNTEVYEKEAGRKKAKTEASQDSINAAQIIKDKAITSQRSELLSSSISAINKHTLIGSEGAGNGIRGKNKRFGFACPICDLSFRDTLALVDHFNSPQHLTNVRKISSASGTGEQLQDGVHRASLEQVCLTLEDLVKASLKKKASRAEPGLSLQDRVNKRREFEQKKAERKKEKRVLKKLRETPDSHESSEVAELMGFGGFSSTKTK